MLFFVVIFLFLFPCTDTYNLPNPIPPTWWWVWIEGSYETGAPIQKSIYADGDEDSNPGGRAYFGFWHAESDGKIFVFGGANADGLLCDLWEKDIEEVETGFTRNYWKYKSEYITDDGILDVPTDSDYPGSRFSPTTWLDSTGNLWLFGGYGYSYAGPRSPETGSDWNPGGPAGTGRRWLRDKGHLQDLWEFDVGSGLWVDRCGASSKDIDAERSSVPGSRYGALGAADGDTLYLYGGYGMCNSSDLTKEGSFSYCNDQWRYDSGSWISISDHNTAYLDPSSNHPGARAGGQMFLFNDAMYLFAGSNGMDLNSLYVSYNSPSYDSWFIVSDITSPLTGLYEVSGEWSDDSIPLGRRDFGYPAIYEGEYNEMYFFSGSSIYRTGKDLWKARLNGTFSWFLMRGNSYDNALYGAYYQTRRDYFNKWSNPPQRRGFGSFALKNLYFVIFGGYSDEREGFMNDMWFTVDISKIVGFTCAGSSRFDSDQCGGHGTCVSEDLCDCDDGYVPFLGTCVVPTDDESSSNSGSSGLEIVTTFAMVLSFLNLFLCIFLYCSCHVIVCIRMLVCVVTEIYGAFRRRKRALEKAEDKTKLRERFYSKRLPIPMDRRKGRRFERLRKGYRRDGYDFEKVVEGFKPYFKENADEKLDGRKMMNEHGIYKHQEQALWLYTMDKVLKEMNQDIMKDKFDSHREMITAIDFALFHNNIQSKKKVVYRAMDLTESEAEMYVVGEQFYWKGYVSCSERKRKVKKYRRFVFHIDISECKQNMRLEEYSSFPIEREVVLPNYIEFLVEKNDGKEIRIKVLPQKEVDAMFSEYGAVDEEEEEKYDDDDDDDEREGEGDYDYDEEEEEEDGRRRRKRGRRKERSRRRRRRSDDDEDEDEEYEDDRPKQSSRGRGRKRGELPDRPKRGGDDDDDDDVVAREIYFKKERRRGDDDDDEYGDDGDFDDGTESD